MGRIQQNKNNKVGSTKTEDSLLVTTAKGKQVFISVNDLLKSPEIIPLLGDTRSYKIFTALVTDFGAAGNPTMIILENTLSGTPTINYISEGHFHITLAKEFPLASTTAVFGNLQGPSYVNKSGPFDEDYVHWNTTSSSTGLPVDGQMHYMTVEIKVF